jgi:predicted nucleic acid-binding Zn ribbon protein
MLDDALTACPECEGKLKRLIGAGAGIIFKGSGFYQTDYRSDSYKSGAKKEKEASKKSEKKPKKEKPAAKSD